MRTESASTSINRFIPAISRSSCRPSSKHSKTENEEAAATRYLAPVQAPVHSETHPVAQGVIHQASQLKFEM